jgi:heavy metal sensor kinase
MSRLPIRVRVTAAFALAMAAVLAGSGWFLYSRLDSHLAVALDRELQVRSQDLAALVREPGGSLADERSSRLIERGESYAQLIGRDGQVLDATRPLGATPLLGEAERRAAERKPLFDTRPFVPGLDEESRLLARAVSRQDGHPILVVGATTQDNAETLAAFRDELLIAGPLALLLASLAGYFLAGVSLRPVESMRRRAAAFSAERAGERLPVPPTGDELERLGATLNEMLGRLEDALERERGFVADAGHELRTPLALLRTELELALRHGDSPDELREAIRSSSQEVDRLAQLAEDLLLIARSGRDGVPLRVETLDPAELLAAAVERFRWRAEAAGRVLVSQGRPGARVRGDRLRLEQALANVVDNALRHGNGAVYLTLEQADSRVALHVTDEGLGFPATFLPEAFARFTRADRASGPGTGLGLSIVETIAEAHGGSAHAANRPAGGADVWIDLPAETVSSAVHPSGPTSAPSERKEDQR